MPMITAAGAPYRGFPTQSPSEGPASGYENIQAGPGAFGAAEGGALERLGGTLDTAGNRLADAAVTQQALFNKTVADSQTNNAEKDIGAVLRGDPNNPNDPGYFGLHGDKAMLGRKGVEDKVDEIIAKARGNLQNPRQALLFDDYTRRFRNYVMNDIGQHYDREYDHYKADTAVGQLKLAGDNISVAANNGDTARFNDTLKSFTESMQNTMRMQGSPPDKIEAATVSFVRESMEKWVRAQAVKDPLGAQKFVEEHKDTLGDRYDDMSRLVKAGAEKAQTVEDMARVRTGSTTVPEKYQPLISQAAAKHGVPAELLTRVLDAESGFNPGAVSPTGARGIAQFISSTAAQYGVNVNDEASSINGAANYLADLHKQTGSWQKALTGYLGSDPWKDKSYTGKGVIQLAAALDKGETPDGAVEVWGDSLGVGLQSQLKSLGKVHGGDTPQTILDNIKGQPEGYWQGKTIVLPSGSNGNQMPVVEQTIDYLKSKGANVVAVGYGPKFPEKNAALQDIAKRQGVQVVPASDVAASEGVHPSPRGYATMAAQVRAIPTTMLPPHEDGELPDNDVPGLNQLLSNASKMAQKEGWSPQQFQRVVQGFRKEANANYANQQHAYRANQEALEASDEAIKMEYHNRMTSNSPNYPTTDEVEADPRIKLSKTKEHLIGYIERQTRPDPLSKVSARNQTALFNRIHEDDDKEDKIRSEDEINKAYVNGQITWDAKDKLIEDFNKAQGAATKVIEKRKADLGKAIEPRISPMLASGVKREEITLFDPGFAERKLNWQNAVDDKIAEYRKAGKNPHDLFVPGKPDYVGSEEFLKGAGAAPPPGMMRGALAPIVKPATSPPDLSTKEKIQDAYLRGTRGEAGGITREEAIEAARKIPGLLLEPTPSTVPMR